MAKAVRKAITERMKWQALLFWTAHFCPECGGLIDPDTKIEWDHRQALCHDGPHRYENIKPIHADCHKLKSARDHKANCKVKRLIKGPKQRKGPPIRSRGFDKGKSRGFGKWVDNTRHLDREDV